MSGTDPFVGDIRSAICAPDVGGSCCNGDMATGIEERLGEQQRDPATSPADLAPQPGKRQMELDPAQQRIVDHRAGPLLVLAGPGTGKTTTLTEAAAVRIGQHGADRVLTLTYSRRAAAELKTGLSARLGSGASPRAMTVHSFCYALLRRFADRPVRLLSGPEQEFRVREVLAGSRESAATDWPADLRRAFPTRAFAAEVRAVLARARHLGMDPADVMAAGRAAARDDWVRIGAFFEEYLDVLDAEGAIDYAELVHRSRILLADPQVRDVVAGELDWILVDEFSDADPAQIGLLQALAGDGRQLIAFADPDQSIYAFRGAEASGTLAFPDRFRTRDGQPAPVVCLPINHRCGGHIQTATRNLANRLGLHGRLPADVLDRFRHPEPDPDRPPGRVHVISCANRGVEASQIADLLRRAHLHDGLDWSQMAVLVRNGKHHIPGLTRALTAAGVPVEVAGDEIPLAQELATRPLLTALRLAAEQREPQAGEAELLLTSPLGGLDGMAHRRLGRLLRQRERDDLAGTGLPRRSGELIRLALADPSRLDDCPESAETIATKRLADLLAGTRALVESGATAQEALWHLWAGTGWPDRLQSAARRGGDSGRRANRDLDAVVALFEAAARSDELVGLRGASGFLAEIEAQQIPADARNESAVRGSAVRVLTAHRAKGLEWELAVVASVQEGSWPDSRRRASLLEPDRLDPAGLQPPEPVSSRVAEERRLFYVACTRARSRLVVTAVDGTDGENDQPSRFLAELGVGIQQLASRPRRPLSLPALIGDLRRFSLDPQTTPALRSAAATRLARLADARSGDGQPLAVRADPARWWGMRSASDSAGPGESARQPIRLSGSQLGVLLDCPRQWFLARKARAESARGPAASFGSIVHVLAQYGAGAALDPAAVAEHLDSVWHQVGFDANWLSATERIDAEAALERFAEWQAARPDRELLGTEVRFGCDVDVGSDTVRLTGVADRVERDPDGRIRIVDFKTGKHPPKAADVATSDQLGVYQLAVLRGGFEEITGPAAQAGGAELVYLRLNDGDGPLPRVFEQASLADVPFPAAAPADSDEQPMPSWVHGRLGAAAQVVRSGEFPATPGPACRYCPFFSSCPAQAAGQQVVS
jgi:superfamily I DNA/RNA helicase/RecB family exonuclease